MRFLNKSSILLSGVLVLTLTGCGSDDDSDDSANGADGAGEIADERVDYTDPAQADDKCGVYQGLFALDNEQAEQSEDAMAMQFHERLVLMTASMQRLEDLAEDDAKEQAWGDAAQAYQEVVDWYETADADAAEDDFVYLLAVAATEADVAYAADEEDAAEECELDISELMVGN